MEGFNGSANFTSGRNFSYTFNEQLWNYFGNGGPQPLSTTSIPVGCRHSQIKAGEHKVLIVEEELPSKEYCELWAMMVIDKYFYHPMTTVRHSGYANMGMADGHVEHLSPDDTPPAAQYLTAGQGWASPAVKSHYWCDLTRAQ